MITMQQFIYVNIREVGVFYRRKQLAENPDKTSARERGGDLATAGPQDWTAQALPQSICVLNGFTFLRRTTDLIKVAV